MSVTRAGRACLLSLIALASVAAGTIREQRASAQTTVNEVLHWNQIFIDTLIATNTPNSSSQRLGAILHAAMFDAYNGIERRYTPILVEPNAPSGASRRAAVVSAAYTALAALFPSRAAVLADSYAESVSALTGDDDDGGRAHQLGLDWGTEVALAVLARRSGDGFSGSYPAFTGGTAVGQWRPVPPATAMSAQGLAFTVPFVLESSVQFRPASPRPLTSEEYTSDFNLVKALGRRTGSMRTDEQTALAPFWEGNASVHWNQAANQMARANGLSLSQSNRLFAVLNIAMADAAITIWSAKRLYGDSPGEVTWRPATAIPLAGGDFNADTTADPGWLPLVTTPSHPEYPAGHPALNGAAATVLRRHFSDAQTFTLTTTGLPSRTYESISAARRDGNDARVWGGMHYPTTVAISDGLGETIAEYVHANAMQRTAPGASRPARQR